MTRRKWRGGLPRQQARSPRRQATLLAYHALLMLAACAPDPPEPGLTGDAVLADVHAPTDGGRPGRPDASRDSAPTEPDAPTVTDLDEPDASEVDEIDPSEWLGRPVSIAHAFEPGWAPVGRVEPEWGEGMELFIHTAVEYDEDVLCCRDFDGDGVDDDAWGFTDATTYEAYRRARDPASLQRWERLVLDADLSLIFVWEGPPSEPDEVLEFTVLVGPRPATPGEQPILADGDLASAPPAFVERAGRASLPEGWPSLVRGTGSVADGWLEVDFPRLPIVLPSAVPDGSRFTPVLVDAHIEGPVEVDSMGSLRSLPRTMTVEGREVQVPGLELSGLITLHDYLSAYNEWFAGACPCLDPEVPSGTVYDASYQLNGADHRKTWLICAPQAESDTRLLCDREFDDWAGWGAPCTRRGCAPPGGLFGVIHVDQDFLSCSARDSAQTDPNEPDCKVSLSPEAWAAWPGFPLCECEEGTPDGTRDAFSIGLRFSVSPAEWAKPDGGQ